jgi:hypothetical protein
VAEGASTFTGKWLRALFFQRRFSNRFSTGAVFRSGVDVMITIFCDLCQILAQKMAFFSKTNVVIKCYQKLAVV